MAENTNNLSHGNGFDPDVIERYVSRFDTLEATKDKLKEEHKAEIDSLKEDQRIVLEEAKREHGIPVKAFEHFFKKRELQRALAEFDENGDPAIIHDADLIAAAFGLEGTPLGDFAEGRE